MEAKGRSTHPAVAKLLQKEAKPRACVVGGGWNGLYALKWFIEEGLDDVVLFEMTDSIGGVWVYTEDKPGAHRRATACCLPLLLPPCPRARARCEYARLNDGSL